MHKMDTLAPFLTGCHKTINKSLFLDWSRLISNTSSGFCLREQFLKLALKKKQQQMKERSQLINRLPSQTLTYLATSCEPWSLLQHKWQGNKRCYKILLRPQLSSIQSSQEQIEKYRDKKQTEGLQTTGWKNAAVTHIEPGWLTTASLQCFVLSQQHQKGQKISWWNNRYWTQDDYYQKQLWTILGL